MKKLICVLLAILILCPVFTALAESGGDAVSFDPTVANTFNLSTDEWMASSDYRALLTIALLASLPAEASIDYTTLLTSASFVGRKDDVCFVSGSCGDRVITIMYLPSMQIANYSVSTASGLSDAQKEQAMESALSLFATEYYKNSSASILNCLNAIQEAIDS